MTYKKERFGSTFLYYFDIKGILFKCLQNNAFTRPDIKKYLGTIAETPNASDRELAGGLLMAFKKDGYDISINRVIITFTLYYSTLMSRN